MSSLNPLLIVGYHLQEALLLHSTRSKENLTAENFKVFDMMTLDGIRDPRLRISQYPHHLSGKIRQRVMIAMAFLYSPKLFITNEPTTALDATIQTQILDLFTDLRKK